MKLSMSSVVARYFMGSRRNVLGSIYDSQRRASNNASGTHRDFDNATEAHFQPRTLPSHRTHVATIACSQAGASDSR